MVILECLRDNGGHDVPKLQELDITSFIKLIVYALLAGTKT